MKLEVGMFIRTPLGIDKIIKKREMTVTGETCYLFYLEQGHNLFYTPSSYFSIDSECYDVEEIKARHNIIDLIEEHDILKIEEQKGVYTICEVEAFREPYTNYYFLGVRLDNTPVARKLYELNIKSIVMKEQFESMSYKVGE